MPQQPSRQARTERIETLHRLLEERILVLDGAMGSMIQSFGLEESDFRGDTFGDHPSELQGDNELLSITRPDVIRSIHDQFFEAGADICETNTFGSNAISQADYSLEHTVRDLNLASARLARESADAWTAKDPSKPRFVAGAVGPTPKTLSISPDVNDPAARSLTFEALQKAYRDQVEVLIEGDVDILLVETIFDTLNAKAALVAIDEVFEATGLRLPVMIPLASVIATEIMTGRRRPVASKTSSMATRAAFAFRVSKIVSTSRMSTSPSIRTSTWSRYAFCRASKVRLRAAGSFTSGEMERVLGVGPTAPATKRGVEGSFAVQASEDSRASRAEARLRARTVCSRE